MNKLTAILSIFIIVLIVISANLYTENQRLELSDDQTQANADIIRYKSDIQQLEKERNLLSKTIDSLIIEINHIKGNGPNIVDKINNNENNTNNEVIRIQLLPSNERDIWWTDVFTTKDSITWGRIDSLQY